jgi:hypothetical protein
MKRLIVNKNEIVAEVVERIMDEPGGEITLVVPKNSVLGESASNFHLLKREADGMGKKISIESVDAGILVLAKASQLEAMHPFLDPERRPSSLSDIVPRSSKIKSEEGKITAVPKTSRVKIVSAESRKENISEIRDEQFKTSGYPSAGGRRGRLEIKTEEREAELVEVELPKKRRLIKRRVLIGTVAAVVAAALAVFITGKFFSRATIDISFNKTLWTYEHSFTADAAVSKMNIDKNLLAGELFTAHKNVTQLFPASGSATVSEKAAGKITVYNAYSSTPQTLVAMTRFSTPDGKIFRLANQIVVPGAQITNGKIIPASIDANLVADKPGPDYNVGPVPRLVLPGFKGTPRYDSFYGEIKQPLQGGFTGQKAVPTSDDISKAKSKTSDILKTSLENYFLNSYPSDFKILDGASDFNITKLNVNEKTDANGNFSVFGEADLQAVGFKETDLRAFLLSIAKKDNPNSVFTGLNIDYSQVKPDFKRQLETFNVSVSGTLAPDFSADDFKTKILGKSITDIKKMVSALPGLSSAKVSLWPIWLGSLPSEPDRVKIEVN